MLKNLKLLSVVSVLALLASPVLAQDGYGGAYGSNYGAGAANPASVYETRFSTMEDQIRVLTGRNEQLEYALRRMDQAMQRMQSDYEARLAHLETLPQVTQPAPTVTASAATRTPVVDPEETPNGRLGDLKMQGERVTGGSVAPKASPLPSKPDDYGLNLQEQYDRALGLLREAKYEEAEKAFKSFIDKNAQDKQAESARYWYGETFYVRGKFNDAAVAFADAFQQNPKGAKAPDALLKLGMSLGALGKTQDACTTYASLKKEYPNAPVALRSRVDQERAHLKCVK